MKRDEIVTVGLVCIIVVMVVLVFTMPGESWESIRQAVYSLTSDCPGRADYPPCL